MIDPATPARPLPSPLPPSAAPAVAVVRRLVEAGHETYLVGGAVRDLLLGLPPGDFDVATAATPARVQELFPRTHPVGLAFGVVVVAGEGPAVEVATFRTEAGYSDGRRPDAVTLAGTVETDARRRDFTVNALYLDPLRGLVLDPAGGWDDCGARLLRTVGDPAARLREDALRLLRAPRLAAQCGLAVDSATAAALAAERDGIRRVAQERIGQEIAKLLTGPAPAAGLEILAATGLLALVLPEAEAMRGVPQPPQYHPEGDVWTHTLLMFRASPARSLPLGLAILLHDAGKPATLTHAPDRIRFHGHAALGAQLTLTVAQRLRLPVETGERAAELVAQHLRFQEVRQMRPATLKRFLRQPHFVEQLELHRLDCLASHGDLANHDFCVERLAALSREDLAPPPLLRGADLLALGYREGPLLGRVLRELETAQLEGAVATPEAARQWVRERFGPPGQ